MPGAFHDSFKGEVKVLLSILAMALIAAAFLSGCAKDTPQDRVRNVVQAVQKSVENKDLKTVLSHLSEQYRDQQGNDRESVKGLLLYYFLQHQNISVVLTNLDISIYGSSAAARFQAILSGRTGTGAGTVLPEAVNAFRFEVGFTRESDAWKVTNAKWERFGDPL